ncbi:MAG: UDP-N-acetylmuramoyl-tripeptide--D-alanyl-D-alanine ligase [Prevotella sp.]|nr:UDP-N-acetylmuramoyl-tripeptide--D-alanyl-D-alanine ligase [Prevotella sp.]
MNTRNLYDLYKQHPVITTDSRNCPEGSIFIALKGETFDGNKFAAQALESGCAYAVVDNGEYVEDGDNRYILVDDTLQTYKALAREHRRQFDIPVIGITGTNGKTTTKELIASVLRQKYNVLATEGNFNNDVGVPKTLFRMNKEHEIAIIEMGASHPGDIKTLAETAEPDYGIITNVGLAHLQGFGSLKGVIRTKGELYKFLASKENSTVFINADNNSLLEILPDNVWVTPYSTNKDNEEDCIIGEVVSCDPYLTMRWHEPLNELSDRGEQMEWHEVSTQLIGRYNIDNVLAAVAVGINFGIEPQKICKALNEYKPTNNRSQLVETGSNRLIVDAYNANPTSMLAALDNFEQIKAENKMMIIGQMNELGADSEEEHRRIVNRIRQMATSNVWLVGEAYEKIKCHYRKFNNADEAKKELKENPKKDHLILIKGSNSLHLSELTELL